MQYFFKNCGEKRNNRHFLGSERMNELFVKALKGAVIGFLGAVMFDLQKWNEAVGTSFDWKVAGIRWIKGAVAGALGAVGISA